MTPTHALVDLREIRGAKGALTFGEVGTDIPFAVQRVFTLFDLPEGGHRGGHAHIAQHQFLMMASGRCVVTVDDGFKRTDVPLDRPSQALYVPPMLWLDLKDFSKGASCVVLASGLYDEADYIRDHEAFLARAGIKR